MLILKIESSIIVEITIPPKSVNVSLNGVAEFNCTAVAANFVWKKNGMDVNNGIGTVIKDTIVNEVQSIRKSMLKLTVSSVIDIASNITCTAVKNSPFSNDESEPAILLVQGIAILWCIHAVCMCTCMHRYMHTQARMHACVTDRFAIWTVLKRAAALKMGQPALKRAAWPVLISYI